MLIYPKVSHPLHISTAPWGCFHSGISVWYCPLVHVCLVPVAHSLSVCAGFLTTTTDLVNPGDVQGYTSGYTSKPHEGRGGISWPEYKHPHRREVLSYTAGEVLQKRDWWAFLIRLEVFVAKSCRDVNLQQLKAVNIPLMWKENVDAKFLPPEVNY